MYCRAHKGGSKLFYPLQSYLQDCCCLTFLIYYNYATMTIMHVTTLDIGPFYILNSQHRVIIATLIISLPPKSLIVFRFLSTHRFEAIARPGRNFKTHRFFPLSSPHYISFDPGYFTHNIRAINLSVLLSSLVSH